jgi:hypothetical protein
MTGCWESGGVTMGLGHITVVLFSMEEINAGCLANEHFVRDRIIVGDPITP